LGGSGGRSWDVQKQILLVRLIEKSMCGPLQSDLLWASGAHGIISNLPNLRSIVFPKTDLVYKIAAYLVFHLESSVKHIDHSIIFGCGVKIITMVVPIVWGDPLWLRYNLQFRPCTGINYV